MLGANKKTVLLYSVSAVVTLLAMMSTACSESLDVSSVAEVPAPFPSLAQSRDSLPSADSSVQNSSVQDSSAQDPIVRALFENVSITGKTVGLEGIAYGNDLSSVYPVVMLYELDPVTLDATGKILNGSYDERTETFRFDSIAVNSPYAMVEVCSKSNIKRQPGKGWEFAYGNGFVLRKVVDLRENQDLEIGVIGHLKDYRTVLLLQSGMAYDQAKQQANREILDAFGFFKKSFDLEQVDSSNPDDTVALDFIRYYSQSNPSVVVSTVGRIGSFDSLSDSVRQSWLWSELRALENDLLDSIRVDSWMGARSNFAAVLKGFGECTPEKEGTVIETSYKLYNLVCKSGNWSPENIVASIDSAGVMTDARDGKTYKTVSYNIVGMTETWLAEDLMFSSSDGNYPFPDALALDSNIVIQSYDECVEYWLGEWVKGKSEGMTAKDTMVVESSCEEYRAKKSCLKYESIWAAVDSVVADKGFYQGVCPDGWHLPTGFEWERLLRYVAYNYDNSKETYSAPKYFELAGFGKVLRQDEEHPWGEWEAYYAMAPNASYRAPGFEIFGPAITFARISSGYWEALPRSINNEIGSVVRVRCVKN